MDDDGGVLYLVVSGAPAPEGIPALVTACQLLRLAEVLQVDLEELTGSADRNETGRPARPAVPVIEQAMMGYGAPGLADGGAEPGREVSLDFLRAQARSAYQACQATRYDAAGRILPGLIRRVETAARIAGSAAVR